MRPSAFLDALDDDDGFDESDGNLKASEVFSDEGILLTQELEAMLTRRDVSDTVLRNI